MSGAFFFMNLQHFLEMLHHLPSYIDRFNNLRTLTQTNHPRKKLRANPNMESKVKELMELRRMKEEIEAEITAAEDEIKGVMGEEETLLAGAFKVSWKTFTSSRLDSTALKKALPEIAARFTKKTTARRFSIN